MMSARVFKTMSPAGAEKSIPAERIELRRLWDALLARRFFKLIGGGSLTERDKMASVAEAYALAGADCIDIAPDLGVVAAVVERLTRLSLTRELAVNHLGQISGETALGLQGASTKFRRPAIMVSLPLDPDPHFRKIELAEPDCIRCGLCLPVCPTEALTLPEALAISQSLCYGCGRCVPVCPTDALSLLPFQVESQIEAVLQHPAVSAVEIHSRYIDPYMLEAFWIRWEPLLRDKLISLCFRPETVPLAQWMAFYQMAERLSPLPVMLQIDGAPMSGNDDPEASRPALESAVSVLSAFDATDLLAPPVTISGGINEHTARWLQESPAYARIAGVGMGTIARKRVWTLSPETASVRAASVVGLFRVDSH
jgi:ferredoxin